MLTSFFKGFTTLTAAGLNSNQIINNAGQVVQVDVTEKPNQSMVEKLPVNNMGEVEHSTLSNFNHPVDRTVKDVIKVVNNSNQYALTGSRQGSTINILLMEEVPGSIYHYKTALDNLSLSYTFVTSWSSLNTSLTGGTSWDLVIVNSYANYASSSHLTALNSYLTNGGKLIFADSPQLLKLDHDNVRLSRLDHLKRFLADSYYHEEEYYYN